MDRSSLRRIEQLNYILGGVLVVITAFMGTREHVLGALVGVVLSAVNFTFVSRLVERMMWAAQGKQVSRVSGLALIPKMILLMGGAAAAILFLPISPIMLAVGLSVFLGSIAVETVRYVLGTPQGDGNSDGAP